MPACLVDDLSESLYCALPVSVHFYSLVLSLSPFASVNNCFKLFALSPSLPVMASLIMTMFAASFPDTSTDLHTGSSAKGGGRLNR